MHNRLAEPFLDDANSFLHGMTFAGHPVSCAVAMANLDIMEDEDVCGNVGLNQHLLTSLLEGLRDIPIVGDVRGAGYFRAIELVRDQATKQTFNHEDCDWLLRKTLSPRLYELGLYCRADDRADPVLVLSPPLIAGETELREIERIVRIALTEASDALAKR